MTKAEVLTLLDQNRNERGIANWNKMRSKGSTLRSFGIGLTQLRKLAKQIGRDRKLAAILWRTDVYDARVIGLLIDEPTQITRDQVEQQVEDLDHGMLRHVFSSCDATLAKSPLALEIAREWMDSQDETRRRCAWGLVYELSKAKGKKAPDDAFFADCIERITREIQGEAMWVAESMNGALMGIGKRTQALNRAAIAAVEKIGPVDVDYGDDNACEPIDVMKHLTSDYIRSKFA